MDRKINCNMAPHGNIWEVLGKVTVSILQMTKFGVREAQVASLEPTWVVSDQDRIV